jgi:glycosyltransferase involved in cell wall biosynthesis
MTPLVSVIMPAYKSEHWIRAAVESALAQMRPPTIHTGIPAGDGWLELIVCDDGSPQPVGLLLRDMPVSPGDRRVNLLRTERNRGISAARNTAARCAQGRWLAFLDADDLWLPQKTGRQLAEVWRTSGPGVSVVYSNASVIDADGKVLTPAMAWPGPVRDLADLVVENRVPCCTAMVRRTAFDEVGGFDEANVLGTEDYQLWLSLAAAGGRFLYVPEALAAYRVHEGQESARQDRVLASTVYALRRAWLGALGARGRAPPDLLRK